MEYLFVKTLHIISSTILFGTGIGSAYYMLRAHLSGNIHVIATTAKHLIFADWVFTATTVVFQPLSGAWMVHLAGISYSNLWVWLSLSLYVLAGICWLPVVWIQIKMGKIAEECLNKQLPLPSRYYRLMKTWILLGIPAFLGLVVVFGLMVIKPI